MHIINRDIINRAGRLKIATCEYVSSYEILISI